MLLLISVTLGRDVCTVGRNVHHASVLQRHVGAGSGACFHSTNVGSRRRRHRQLILAAHAIQRAGRKLHSVQFQARNLVQAGTVQRALVIAGIDREANPDALLRRSCAARPRQASTGQTVLPAW